MGKQLYETTFVLHIAQEICLWSCRRHTSIHQDACWDFLWCSPGKIYWFCGELLVITIKYNFGITFVVANYILHIALAYFIISSRFGPDSRLEQVEPPSTMYCGSSGNSTEVDTSDASNDERAAFAVRRKETWSKSEGGLRANSYIRKNGRSAEPSRRHMILSKSCWGLTITSCSCTTMLLVMAYPSCSFWHQQSFFQPSVAWAADQLPLHYGKSLRSHQWCQ